ncbi:hypothetical protein [Terrihabitans rhizophilus]|uniref:Glycosyltransferase n=1 Tax=Terrihabitans rhizophilus TaxID=3092662 RepID=A0ABU4RT31_9HYPH|nr:hypothetical protein [Terrihabitans sp. PJ23]MDX6807343.1 hypothetical protein [Terrihabitans sp. PJ23]
MISVVIQTSGDEEALLATLASLVPAAADGTVRDVIVVDGSGGSSVHAIADGCGCLYVRGASERSLRLAAGARLAKAPWLLFMEPGCEPEEGWTRDVRGFMERAERQGTASRRAARFQVLEDGADDGLAQAVRRAGQSMAGSEALPALLIHKAFYEELGGFRALPVVEYVDLARRIGRSRMVRLRARLYVPADQRPHAAGLRRLLGAGLLAVRAPTRLVARLYR